MNISKMNLRRTISDTLTLELPSQETYAQLHEIINYYAERKEMLPKTYDELYQRTRDFRLLVDRSDAQPQVIACSHLDIFTPVLAEVKSLAVRPEYQGHGYGRLMVEDCETEARELGIERMFALTYQVEFFKRVGYEIIDIKTLPEKVFKECVVCPFKDNCNETAVIKSLRARRAKQSTH